MGVMDTGPDLGGHASNADNARGQFPKPHGSWAEVRRLDLGKARDAASAALLGEELDPIRGSWLRRVSVVMARRVDGVDVETEYLWEMEELSDRG